MAETATRGVLCKKAFLGISQNLQESTCARVTLLKRRLWHRRFPVNFVKFLRPLFYRTPLDDCSYCGYVKLDKLLEHYGNGQFSTFNGTTINQEPDVGIVMVKVEWVSFKTLMHSKREKHRDICTYSYSLSKAKTEEENGTLTRAK